MPDTLALIPADLGRQSLDLPRIELALAEFIESQEDAAIVDEARRRLDSAAAYYDRESEPWRTAQRLTRRAERRMVPLLPAKHQGKPLPEHAQEVSRPDYRITRDWELMASADGLFEEALANGHVTRRAVVHYIQRGQDAKRVKVVSPITKLAPHTTIVIDPPWDWGDEGDINQFSRAKPTYDTMPLDDIKALPIKSVATPDAHIYLWITNRSLPKGFELLKAWDFRYICALTWCKPSFGMGNYFRGSTEHVLFGVRGSLPLLRRDVGTWFQAPRPKRLHSAKPDAFYELIETCSPGPRLDAFGRKDRPGWTRWPEA